MSDLTVDTKDVEDVTVLYPRGFINAHTVRGFDAAIQKAVARGRVRIVVSCEGLDYIASAGLGAMMGAIEEIRGAGGDLRLAGLNDTVRNIFEILGFNHLYRIYPSEMDAILSFARDGGNGS